MPLSVLFFLQNLRFSGFHTQTFTNSQMRAKFGVEESINERLFHARTVDCRRNCSVAMNFTATIWRTRGDRQAVTGRRMDYCHITQTMQSIGSQSARDVPYSNAVPTKRSSSVLGRIACTAQMRPVATDVVYSVVCVLGTRVRRAKRINRSWVGLAQSCPCVHLVWPDPTQPISWLTQPSRKVAHHFGTLYPLSVHSAEIRTIVGCEHVC